MSFWTNVMNPIYFPFTYVSKSVFRVVSACFKKIDVYQPSGQEVPENMQQWAKSGALDIHIPVKGEEDTLDILCKSYRDWGDLHNGPGVSFFKTQADVVPFFDETFTSQIRAAIQKSDAGPAEKESSSLLNARLFLRLAQDLDRQQFEIADNMHVFETMEQDLLKRLKGEEEDVLKIGFGNDTAKAGVSNVDSGDYMIKERIEAWARLAQHDTERSGIFITTSRSAFEYLLDRSPGAEKVLDLNSIPLYENISEEMKIWQDSLIHHLGLVLENDDPASQASFVGPPLCEGCDTKVSLMLYRVPGKVQHEFFARCVENGLHKTGEKDERSVFKNTLIGFVG
jgi:hypothetical protein